MHFIKLASLFGLAIAAAAAPTVAEKKQQPFKIALSRYVDTECKVPIQLPQEVFWLRSDKCKTFGKNDPDFESFGWLSRHGLFGGNIDANFPKAYSKSNCTVAVYSEPKCMGKRYQFDGIHDGNRCNRVPFSEDGKSIAVTCLGHPPDNVGRGKAATNVLCSAHDGSTYTDADGTEYSVLCNTAYLGTTIGMLTKRAKYNVQSCFASCDSNDECIAVTYTTDHECELFSAISGTVSDPGATSAQKVSGSASNSSKPAEASNDSREFLELP